MIRAIENARKNGHLFGSLLTEGKWRVRDRPFWAALPAPQWCKSWVLGKPKMFTRPTDQSAERWGVLDKTAPDCTEIILPALGIFLNAISWAGPFRCQMYECRWNIHFYDVSSSRAPQPRQLFLTQFRCDCRLHGRETSRPHRTAVHFLN